MILIYVIVNLIISVRIKFYEKQINDE